MLRDTEITGQSAAENHPLRAREEGAASHGLQTNIPVPLPPPNIQEGVNFQRIRRHAIGMQIVCNQKCDAFTAAILGYHSGLPEAERKRLYKEAADTRLSVEKQLKAQRKKDEKARGQSDGENQGISDPGLDGEGQQRSENQGIGAVPVCLPIILNTISSREGWDHLRETCEAAMREIARSFPVWERVAQIPGFGDLGLAVIVAEAGNDLTAYPHHMHLWKRLGLAPYNGKAGSSWKASGGLTKDEWIELGYNDRRRGTIAGDVGLPLFFHKSANAYGAVYAQRKAHTAAINELGGYADRAAGLVASAKRAGKRPAQANVDGKLTLAHLDNDARRIMTKALIKDVWRMWRECSSAA